MNGDEQQAPDSGSWQFKPETPVAPVAQNAPQPQGQPSPTAPAPADLQAAQSYTMPAAPEISWTASEFIAHSKSTIWYAGLVGIGLIVTVLVYFITKDALSVIVAVLVAVMFGFLAAHKPRVLGYHIGPEGLAIGEKLYHYDTFKSFGLLNEGAIDTIVFMPMKRFMPSITLYCPPEEHDKIVDTLSNYLPFAPVSHDMIDQLMHRIRL